MKNYSFPNVDNSIDNQVDNIIKHYRSLVDFTQGKIYLPIEADLVGTPNIDQWPKWKRNLYLLTTPFSLLEVGISKISMASIAIWILSFAVWTSMTIVMLDVAFGDPAASTGSNRLSWWEYLYLGIYVVGILASPVAYLRAFYYLVSKHTSWKSRIIWLISLGAFILYFLSAVQNDYPLAYQTMQEISLSKTIFTIALFLFMIPMSIFSVSIILFGIRFFVWLIDFIFRNFISSYSPYTYNVVKKIITEPVVTDSLSWKLIDLSMTEIKSIREWSRDNLESTEKRTVPAFWFLTLLGLLANTTFFENWLGNLIVYLSQKYSEFQIRESVFTLQLDTFVIFILGIPIALAIIVLVLGIFIGLFRNLAIQSAIIEACTVTLHAKEQVLNIQNKQVNKKRNWWKIFFG